MKVSRLAPTQEGTVEEASPVTVSYGDRRVYNVEPKSIHKRSIYRNFDTPLSETERDVCDLLWWPEGWDGYDAPKPNAASIRHAHPWVRDLYRDVRAELWIKPHVSADEEGNVAFEWWKGQKKLTVYVSPGAVEYVKVERANSSLEMKDGSIEAPGDRLTLWNWLRS